MTWIDEVRSCGVQDNVYGATMTKNLFIGLIAFTVLGVGVLFTTPKAHADKLLQLNEVAAGFDSFERDITYPMQIIDIMGEVYIEPAAIRVSRNCAKHIEFRSDGVFCSPFGDRSKTFRFAVVSGKKMTTDNSGWEAILLNYDTSKVRLLKKLSRRGDALTYYLLIENK